MERQWRWSMVALVIMAVVLQGSGGRVDADVLQPRLAAPSPEFLRYEASAQSGGGAAGLGLVPSPVDWSYLDGEHVMWLGGDAPLPARYDLRTEGRMTAVRDQGTSSACWTFATYGSLESTMMPAETLDFSENNLKNTSGFDYGPNTWGNGDMSTAYLTRWSGPIAEADDPYDPSSTTSPSGLSPIRHVQNVMILPQRPGPLDTADIKRALIDYGALVGSMYWAGDGWVDTAYYKLNTGAYYYGGSADSNHVVAVVGWDDAFPASDFSTPPPGNGAWIVKNSWGTTWGQSGYFFISYYDAVLFKKNPAYCFQAAEPADNYVHVYQYDPLGHTDSFGYGTTTAWEANVFAAAAAENVRAIGFYTLDVSCSYEAKVYGSWNGTTFSNLLSSTKGTIPSPGYHTIVLPSSGAPVASGQTFGVVVKLVTTNYRYPIAFEEPVAGYSMGATASTGQSYMSSNGATWTDVTGRYANTNVCVKAYAGTPSATATLTCQVSPAGAGFVSASPPSADNAYSVGTVVTLTATPSPGYTFTGWSGDLSGTTNPATITMDANKTVTASFAINTSSDSIGIFRPSTNGFYLRSSGGTVAAPVYLGDLGDEPITGDWDGNGTDEIGVFRSSNNAFFLRSSDGTVSSPIFLGDAGDEPIIADWDGNGTDEIGIFRPSTSGFYLRSSTGAVAAPVYLGDSDDEPIIGDWDGDGTDEIGVFRPSTSAFYLRSSDGTASSPIFLGNSDDEPIIGDWDGDGTDEIGVFRPSNSAFYLRSSDGTVSSPIFLGDSGDKPIIGMWSQL